MSTKELVLQEIESMTELELEQILTLVQQIKTESKPTFIQQKPKPPHRKGSGKSILRHAGKWVGDDLQECLEIVYSSRGEAEF
jgi:hypothetical protein